MDIWPMIKSERAAFADNLAALPPADWDRPSLCAGWTVRDVVAHMLATASMTPPRFFVRLAGSGFAFDRMVRRDIDALTAEHGDARLLELYRGRIDARTAPPGPTASWLGETIVHGEDVFRAVRGYRPHPAEHLTAVADFYKNSNTLIGAKRRIDGIALRATDTAWRHGDGPEAAGPMVALVLAMTGRRAALDDLSGDGVAVLRGRAG
jgi:uncharacterized protein (TIGR03083 family)